MYERKEDNIMKKYRFIALVLTVVMLLGICSGCGTAKGKEKIVIYSPLSIERLEDLTEQFAEKFPDYDIVIEKLSTGEAAAKLLTEGADTECDIVYDLSYPHLDKMEKAGLLADLSGIVDFSQFVDDVVTSDHYVVECLTSGAIVLNTEVMAEKGLDEPTCYEDLLHPQYKGLISMPDPKSSGTGYMFLKSLVNAWGEERAFDYFEKLADNVLQFTSSGTAPINSLMSQEVAIGFCMTMSAVQKINSDGEPLKLLFFDEGAPTAIYGQAIIAGKEERKCVRDVFDYLTKDFMDYSQEYYVPEQIRKDKIYNVENYPENIVFADMSNNTVDEQDRLLSMWTITGR